MENIIRESRARRCDTSVDFPDPDGAETMKTVVMRALGFYFTTETRRTRRKHEEFRAQISSVILRVLRASVVNEHLSIPDSAIVPVFCRFPILRPAPGR